MKSILLLEVGSSGFELESGSGVILLEDSGLTASGSITIVDQPLTNVSVSWIGSGSGITLTDSFGEWFAQGLAGNGTYTFTPALAGYVFLPPSQIVTLVGQDVVEINFIVGKFFTAGSFPPSELHASLAGMPGVVLTNVNNPDNKIGTNVVPSLNENLPLVVIPSAQGARGEVRGRFDQFTVINNPA